MEFQVGGWNCSCSEERIDCKNCHGLDVSFTWDEWFDSGELVLGEEAFGQAEVILGQRLDWYREILEEQEALAASIQEFMRDRW